LSELGLEFQVAPSNIPEEVQPGETAQEMVERLSLAKALVVAQRVEQGYVIGADSTVVLEGRPIGKPADNEEARQMLRELRGTRHQVTTGVTVIDAASGRQLTASLTSAIAMRDFSDEEMEASIATGTPLDKAGAYAIQDEVFRPAQLVEGCYTNVVGLPLCRLMEMLEELGYPLPSSWAMPELAECRTECPFQLRRTS
jgi:MAF protein